MKQIGHQFAEYYYLTTEAEVFNINTGKYLKADINTYKLKTTDGIYKSITKKSLYKLVYNTVFCKDYIENLEQEEWKIIEHTDSNYLISSRGRIKSYCDYTAKLLKPQLTKKGYYRVGIIQYGKKINKFVHKLVAEAFLIKPGDNKEYQVHHIDNHKTNNFYKNLQYLTIEEHIKVHNERK